MSKDTDPSAPDRHTLDRHALFAALRARIARTERTGAGAALAHSGQAVVPLAEGIDAALPTGGLARAGLHEVLADDLGAAFGFCAVVLGRTAGPVLWISPDPDAWPSGLARFGLSPAQLVLVRATKADALWAMEEVLRCPAVSGALLMVSDLDLTAARRLQLAAETGGALGLLLRPDGAPAASVALTCWRVTALPSIGVGAQRLGDPRWQLDMLRCRGGTPQSWSTTWRASLDRLDLDAQAEVPEPARRVAERR